MINKIFTSFKNINHKLFISLLVMGLVPTIYTTLRVFWLGNLPGDWSYSIAGQLSWINLIYEVINEAIILPLFYFVGKVLSDKKKLTNRMKTGLLITLGIYIILSIFIMTCTNPLLKAMATDPSIIDASATYIRIEAMASIKIPVEGEGDNHSEYSNERLAIVGDAILDFVIADVFYNDQIKTKGEITTKRSKLVNNRVMHQVMIKEF